MQGLRFSRSAQRDLESIDAETIERFGLGQAERLRDSFLQTLQRLQRLPGSGRERPDLSPPDRLLRSVVVSSAFVVVYEDVSESVRVVRVLHAARDLPSELRNDDGRE
jgi:toxin ParE1/3/4